MLFRVGCRLEFGVLLGTQRKEKNPRYRQGPRKHQWGRCVYLRWGSFSLEVTDDHYMSCTYLRWNPLEQFLQRVGFGATQELLSATRTYYLTVGGSEGTRGEWAGRCQWLLGFSRVPGWWPRYSACPARISQVLGLTKPLVLQPIWYETLSYCLTELL